MFQSREKNREVDEVFDFHARVLVKNKLVRFLVDTSAKVSVIGMKQAKDWGLLDLFQQLLESAHTCLLRYKSGAN